MKKIIGIFITAIMILSFAAASMAAEEETETTLEDGIYLADFNTDSSMFHANEVCEGKGFLFVKDGKMTLHAALVSKSIINLFLGVAEDAEADSAILLDPTTDTVIYNDGYEETVYGFDIPLAVLDEEFDLALIGKKEKWYDHKVSVSNPQPIELEGIDLDADSIVVEYEFDEGGKISFEMNLKEEK